VLTCSESQHLVKKAIHILISAPRRIKEETHHITAAQARAKNMHNIVYRSIHIYVHILACVSLKKTNRVPTGDVNYAERGESAVGRVVGA
jgi:hypothetical protein